MVYQRFDTPLTKEIIPILKGMARTDWPLFFEFNVLGREIYWLNEYGNQRNRNNLYENCDPINYTPWDLNTLLQGINVLWTQPHNSPICQQWITYLDTVKTTFWFEYYQEKGYNQTILQQGARVGLDEARTEFLNLLQELKAFLRALGTPEGMIEEGSGVMRPRKRKQINYHTHPPQTLTHPRKVIMHPQRTYQDVQNELETQLVSLPNYSARVKIGVNASQNPGKKCLSCKLPNNSGALYCTGCGKELPAANEYLLTTLKPATGLNTQQLEQRIKRIQARNLQQKHLRDRKTVEAEISKRQTSCSSGAAPAQPQNPQPQQPTPQQAQTRHARQVPVQGKCPTCGKSNPTGSKFCNQCGTKLH